MQRGFTLVEMLIAVFIAMIIFAIGFTLLNGANKARSDAQSRIRTFDAARLILDRIERDFKDAYPGPWATDKTQLVATYPGPAGNVLEMTTTTDTQNTTVLATGLPGIYSVRYYVLASNQILYREYAVDPPDATQPSFRGVTPTASADFALLPDVASVTFEPYHWDDALKKHATGAADFSDATEINIRLVLISVRDSNGAVKEKSTFQRIVPIPDAFN